MARDPTRGPRLRYSVRVKRTHLAAVAALVVLAVPALTGCFSGQDATTNMQATMNSGNGVDAQAGPVHVENATLVLGPEGSSSVTLLTRLVNTGATPDTLVFASINGVPATITEGAGELAPGASVSFGFESESWINAYGFDAPASTYVPVQLGLPGGRARRHVGADGAPGRLLRGHRPEPATDPAPVASAGGLGRPAEVTTRTCSPALAR